MRCIVTSEQNDEGGVHECWQKFEGILLSQIPGKLSMAGLSGPSKSFLGWVNYLILIGEEPIAIILKTISANKV